MEQSRTQGTVACQQHAGLPHVAIHALVVDPGLVVLGKLASQQHCNATITVGRPCIDQAAIYWQRRRVLRLLITPTRLGVHLQTVVELRTLHPECLRNVPQRVTSLIRGALSKAGSFTRDRSSASLRISSSMVLRPSRRSSSRRRPSRRRT